MKLNLVRPIVFFDLETTGIDISTDHIVEISWHKVYPNGNEEGRTLRVNPGCPIPAAATAIHGITDAEVQAAPTFKQIAKEVAQVFEGADIAGYNSNRFDVPLLVEELMRADVNFDISRHHFIDVQVIFHKMEPRTLSAAYQFYCGQVLDNAHSANADTMATYKVLQAQLERYTSLPNDVASLAEFTSQTRNVDIAGRVVYNDKNQEVFNFGKYKGQLVEDVLAHDTGYYGWIMQGNFSLHTKKVITQIFMRVKQKKS